jgi:xylan 1,4-beta-xylosidase
MPTKGPQLASRSAQTAVTLLSIAVLSACAASPSEPVPSAPPQFEWFRYEGSDPVHDQHPVSANEYRNPILAGFHPDPSIVGVDGDYYLVNSSFTYFPGLPVFHSRDLVSWTQIGHAIERPSQMSFDGLAISEGIFAPAISHHDGTFYIITTFVQGGGNFIITATDPAGPWTDPVYLPSVNGIDPSLFFDDDGRAYVVNNGPPIGPPLYNGHRALWIQEYDVAAGEMIGPRELIVNGGVDLSEEPIWIEAPHIYKVDGRYILIAAEGGTAEAHSEVVFRSDSPFGPYVPYGENPILTQRHLPPTRPDPITSTGHADFVETPAGEWWAVFLGARPYEGNHYNTGRETFLLPVRWEDGWPVMLTGMEVVPYVHERPTLAPQPEPEIPTTGNFTVLDEFEDPDLAPYWNFIRTPHSRWYTLEGGSLTIQARPDSIGGRGQPSFIGRRQQHAFASASTAMRYRPEQPGDQAGLVAFQNDRFNYVLSVARTREGTVVQLERRAGSAPNNGVIASQPVDLPADGTVHLRIEARGALYDFQYALEPDAWTTLAADVDGTILSTATAGGFVGAYFGMYAYTPTP